MWICTIGQMFLDIAAEIDLAPFLRRAKLGLEVPSCQRPGPSEPKGAGKAAGCSQCGYGEKCKAQQWQTLNTSANVYT